MIKVQFTEFITKTCRVMDLLPTIYILLSVGVGLKSVEMKKDESGCWWDMSEIELAS